MKLLNISFLFLYLTLMSCSNNVNKNDQELDSIKAFFDNKIKDKKEEKDSIKFNYQGSWVLKSILEKISQTKSIFLNQELQHFILGFDFQHSNEKILHGYTIHEGGYDFPVKFIQNIEGKNILVEDLSRKNLISIPNGGFSLLPIETNELKWQYKDSTNFYIYKRIDIDIEHEFRKILFEGDYIKTDGQKVSFNRDGSIVNINGFSKFSVIYDFGLGVDFDAIIMFNKKIGNWNDGVIFTYKFEGNKLILNKVTSDWETLDHIKTSEIIELKKIANNTQ